MANVTNPDENTNSIDKWIELLKWRIDYYQQMQKELTYFFVLLVTAAITVPLITERLTNFYSMLPRPQDVIFVLILVGVILLILVGLQYSYYKRGIVYVGLNAKYRINDLLLLLSTIIGKNDNYSNDKCLNCIAYSFKKIEELCTLNVCPWKTCPHDECSIQKSLMVMKINQQRGKMMK